MSNRRSIFVVVAVVIGLVAAYWVGSRISFTDGYTQAQSDSAQQRQEVAEQAVQQAAKVANPFQQVNPLQGVQANPLEKAKKVLNPFK